MTVGSLLIERQVLLANRLDVNLRDNHHINRLHRFGRFEVEGFGAWLRIAIGASVLVPTGSVVTSQRGARLWAAAVRRYLDIDEDIEGLHHIDRSTRYLVVPLHEGFSDVLMLGHLGLDLRFVVRDELLDWPWLGRAIRGSGQIVIRPEATRAGFRELVEAVEESLGKGESPVVFPQGSILGIEAAFQSGAFRLADRFGVQVLPVVITGTHRVWEHPYTDRLRFGQRVSMRVLPPLQAGEAESRMRDLERRMKQIALSPDTAGPRRFDPEHDGYWDDYRYSIDPDFTDVASKVARHRARALATSHPWVGKPRSTPR
ncbi:MAG: lysophospholipid acyltransferase family protein [Actinomycetota bacterium]|nr:lysophospholipid acyltransferase family protein [Actinomycetota bacterium]